MTASKPSNATRAFGPSNMSAHSKGPTLEQLHTVWLKRSRNKLWPATFQEAMEHPLCSRILKVRVLQLELVQLHAQLDDKHMPRSSRVTKPPRAPDRAAYWMDSKDPEETA